MAAVELHETTLRDDLFLSAYWRLEGTTADAGNYNLTNINTVAFNAAKFNNGADPGDGNTTKLLSIADNLGISNGSASFVFWTSPYTLPGLGSQFNFFEHVDNTNDIAFGVRLENAGGTQRINFDRGRLGVAGDKLTVDYTMGTGQFQLVGLSYNTTSLIGYVNGTAIGTAALAGNGSDTVTSQFVLCAGRGSANHASAIIDDFAVFSRGLAGTEMSGLFEGTIPLRTSSSLDLTSKFW